MNIRLHDGPLAELETDALAWPLANGPALGQAAKAKSVSLAKRAGVSLWANRFMRVTALNPARRRGASPCCFNSSGRSFRVGRGQWQG